MTYIKTFILRQSRFM